MKKVKPYLLLLGIFMSSHVFCQYQVYVIVEKDSLGVNKYREIEFPTDESPDGGYYADAIHIYKDSIVVFSTRKTGVFDGTHGADKKKCIYQIIKGEFVKTKEWKSIYTQPVKVEKPGYFTYDDGTVMLDGKRSPLYPDIIFRVN